MSYAVQQCKNFQNRSTFDQVTESLKVGTFLRYSVDCLERATARETTAELHKDEKQRRKNGPLA